MSIYPITKSDVLITWSDVLISSPCILTFEVDYSTQSAAGPFRRINDYDITFTSFVYSTDESGMCPYKSMLFGFDEIITFVIRIVCVCL